MSDSFSLPEFRNQILQEFDILITIGVIEAGQPEIDQLLEIAGEYPRREGDLVSGRITYFSCRAYGVSDALALRLAAAVETLHNWSLIHEDIEDGPPVRRQKPALPRQYGVPLALNASNFLLVKLWTYLQSIDGLVSYSIAQKVREEFTSLILQMIQGRHYELSWIHQGDFRRLSQNKYFEMTSQKISRRGFAGPLRLGALAAGVPPPPEFHEAGKNIGIAYQIRKDTSSFFPHRIAKSEKTEWSGGLAFPLILALEDCPDEDFRVLSRLIRGEVSPGDADRVQAILQEKDISKRCRERIQSFLQEGRRALEPAFSRVLVSKWADLIRELVQELSDSVTQS